MTRLADYIMDFIADQGVGHVFFLPGGGCMHLVDALGCCQRLEAVTCLHEQACAFAAEHYAEYASGLGVALVTTGPGGTNAVTGVACAWVESAACLFLSGQVKRADLLGPRGVRSMGQQELDVVSVVRPITKYAATVMEPESIRFHLEKAVFLARSGRPGPVWLDIPLDVQAAQVCPEALRRFDPGQERGSAGRSDLGAAAAHAVRLLRESRRPVVLVGNGVRLAGAQRELRALIERIGAPVLTTWKAADLLPEDHPLYAGRPGSAGQRGANFTQQNADWLLVLGARLDLPQTAFNHGHFAPRARKVMVDADPAELAKMQVTLDVAVCADAGAFIGAMLREEDRLAGVDRTAWVKRCKDWQARYPVVLPEYLEPCGDRINPYALVDALSDEVGAGDVVVVGSSGASADMFMQAFRVKEGQRLMQAPGLGAMGTGLPGAIGACLASGRRRTVCVNGEGGLQLNIQELATVRRLDLPLKLFVVENGGYASIRAMQNNHFQGRLVGSTPSSGLLLPDMLRLAEAYGLRAEEVRGGDPLCDRIRAVLKAEGPVVCVVRVSPDTPTAPRVTSRVTPEGTVVSCPMEDMWPFLDRDELARNMSP